MKKIIYAMALVSVLSSCSDFLLQKPQGSITSETMELTEQTLTSMCNAMYKAWWGENYGFNCRMASICLAADDAITGNFGTTRLPLDDEMRVPVDNKDVEVLWAEFYQTIHTANNLIELISTNTSLSDEIKRSFLGEAYFMRSLMYFYIVRIWGDAPAITDPSSVHDIDGDVSIPRKKTEDIYKKIIVPDAQNAEMMLGDVSRDSEGQAPTKWAAKTLLTDIYVNMAGWPLKQTEYWALAAEKAEDIIKHSPHRLMPSYSDLWMKDKSSDKTEHIFSLHHQLNYLPSQYAISYMGTEEGGWCDYAADPVFYTSFPDDKRKEFCYTTSTVDTKGKSLYWTAFATESPYIRKYRNYGGCGTWGIMGDSSTRSSLSEGLTPIYRFADVLLLFAEASNKSKGSPTQEAYDAINEVRDRAFGDTSHRLSGLTSAEFDQAVFDEFGWENVFEFKRWFQLVRTEKVDEMLARNKKLNVRINCNHENYLFPVPGRQVQLRKWKNNIGY